MIQYIKVKHVATCFEEPPHRIIGYLKQIDTYTLFDLDYDCYMKYGDTIKLFNYIKKIKQWKVINYRLRPFIELKEDELYSKRSISEKKVTAFKRKIDRTIRPGIAKTTVEVSLQKHLPNDFKRGGITQ